MSNDQGKWKETTNQEPNFDNTDVGKILDGLQQLHAHYDSELKKSMNQLQYLQQALVKLETQKKTRKTDSNG